VPAAVAPADPINFHTCEAQRAPHHKLFPAAAFPFFLGRLTETSLNDLLAPEFFRAEPRAVLRLK